MIRKLLYHIKLILITGKNPQSFLDAFWISGYLKLFKGNKAKFKALKILALSPHYYYKKLQKKGLSKKQFILKEHQRNYRSRFVIRKELLDNYLHADQYVIDYGCGPGYLANLVSQKVENLYALDISEGVLACAKIINGSDNIKFLNVLNDNILENIPKKSIDLIYSFAVFQHIQEKYIPGIIELFSALLKDGGKIIMHIIIDDKDLKTEMDWKNDKSLIGRLKYKYGLNCFTRDKNYYLSLLKDYGFENIRCESANKFFKHDFDDIYHQHIITANKKF